MNCQWCMFKIKITVAIQYEWISWVLFVEATLDNSYDAIEYSREVDEALRLKTGHLVIWTTHVLEMVGRFMPL